MKQGSQPRVLTGPRGSLAPYYKHARTLAYTPDMPAQNPIKKARTNTSSPSDWPAQLCDAKPLKTILFYHFFYPLQSM